MVLVVFALPTRYRFWPFQALNKAPETSPSLIDWKTVETKLPWGVILLLGGGFAVSDACTKSGLSKWLVAKCMILVGLPAWLINAIVCVLTAALTQVNNKSYENPKGPFSLTRDTVCNCVLLRKYGYNNFDFSFGQSRCKSHHNKLKLWYLYYLSYTQWHKIRTK